MREPYQPPAASPAGPPNDRTHQRHSHAHPRHSRTHAIPAPTHAIPAPTYVIPAKAGIHPPATALPKRQPPSRRLQKSTQCDRVRRTTTKTRARACAHARERQRHSISLLPKRQPPFPPATKTDRIRQKPTETRARAFPNSRARASYRTHIILAPTHVIPTLTYVTPTPTYVIPTPTYVIPTPTYVTPTPTHVTLPHPPTSHSRTHSRHTPAPTHVIPAKAGIPPPDMDCAQLAADSWSYHPQVVAPMNRNETRGDSHWIHCRAVWYNILLYTPRPIVRGHLMIPTRKDGRR